METHTVLPWYIAGPLVGLTVPLLLWIGNKSFGISSSLRHTCATVYRGKNPYLAYDWKGDGLWNLVFAAGLILGGWGAVRFLGAGGPVDVAAQAADIFAQWGLAPSQGLLPAELFSWSSLATAPGVITIVLGGFLVGFGARWAGGCTSGHGITGTSNLDKASIVAVLCFLIGGIFAHWVLLPGVMAL